MGLFIKQSAMNNGVTFFAAFIGGALTLLPSCGPLLLPAFFAYSFKEKRSLISATAFFGLGFALVFIPFGFGARFIASILLQRAAVNDVLGAILIVFALLAFSENQSASASRAAAAAPMPSANGKKAFSWVLPSVSLPLPAAPRSLAPSPPWPPRAAMPCRRFSCCWCLCWGCCCHCLPWLQYLNPPA